MTCLSSSRWLAVFSEVIGLYNRHIYSILDVCELEWQGKKYRLLKLRNPWGKKGWRGSLPKGVRDSLAVEQDAGTFWIPYEKFARYFCEVTVNKLRPDWTCLRVMGVFGDCGQAWAKCFRLDVAESGGVELELFADGRCLESGPIRGGKAHIDLGLLVCRMDANGLELVAYVNEEESFVSLSFELDAGRSYMVCVSSAKARVIREREKRQLRFDDGNYFRFNLVVHSAQTVFVNKLLYF
jgi:hypothetical protein